MTPTPHIPPEVEAKLDEMFLNCLHDTETPFDERFRDLNQQVKALISEHSAERERLGRIDESMPNASDDGKHVRVHVPQRNHVNGTEYDKGWNACWDAFWTARWQRVGELSTTNKED